MAIHPSSNLPELIDNTWINQNPDQRLRAIDQMRERGAAGQAALLYIAQHDDVTEVRCGAVRFLTDIAVLDQFQSADAEIAVAAQQQIHRLLAGVVESPLSEVDRLAGIASLPLPAVKQIALLTKSKAAGTAALDRINEAEELADLGLFAASVHVRKNAVMKIEDSKLWKELYNKLRDSDKTVAKLLEQRLANLSTAIIAEASDESVPTEPDIEPKAPLEISASQPTENVQTDSQPDKTPGKTLSNENDKKLPPPNPAIDLPQIEQQLIKLSFKHTEALNTMRNTLNRVRKAVSTESPDLAALAETLHTKLSEKLEKNHIHQEQLEAATVVLLEQLQLALDTGQSHDAMPAWDKIQGNINNTRGKIRAALQKQANVHKTKLNELRNWKTFAATEKKKELITQMQHLLETKMHAADLSRHISKMHEEWKSLGRSNHNEQLWREFKKLSDKAYEPCKEYFKQRKQLMVTNFQKRREICDKLEAELTKLDTETDTSISEINKLLNDADNLWKEYAPIEQSKIKPLQKRYYAAINQLRKSRKQSLRGNSTQKLELIAQANALVEHADNQHAIREAKRLQQEWKNIGPTSFKEDRKYWEDFRAACDKIFAKRNSEANAERDTRKRAESKLGEILQSLESIFQLDDEAFRSARNDYQTFAQQFSNSIDPHQRNQQKRTLEQFNGIKRKIDSRYKSLPDKKQLQLRNNVLEKARFLEAIESKLLLSQNDAEFAGIKAIIDTSSWQSLAGGSHSKYDEILNTRMQKIMDSGNLESLQKLAEKCANQARTLCIEVEIRANIETPKEDQGLRMQIQLDQLKNGFGKLKAEPKDNNAYALDMELQSYCIGPLESIVQQQLAPRMAGAIKKLV